MQTRKVKKKIGKYVNGGGVSTGYEVYWVNRVALFSYSYCVVEVWRGHPSLRRSCLPWVFQIDWELMCPPELPLPKFAKSAGRDMGGDT